MGYKVNYACGFNESQTEKYFEGIILTIIIHLKFFPVSDWFSAHDPKNKSFKNYTHLKGFLK